MIVIADTGPINYLVRIDQIGVLPVIYLLPSAAFFKKL
jgi:hypothetical protein